MTPHDSARRGARAAQRSRLYWLLAGLLLAPADESALAALRAMALENDAGTGLGDLLADFARRAAAADRAALAVEHTRLFGGLGPSYGPPPPLESAQRGGGPETTLQVVQAYRDAGYADIDPALPDDHLAVELKFMALLTLREHEAAAAGDERGADAAWLAQRTFLDTHLLAWLPAYARQAAAEARDSALAALLHLIDRAAAADRAYLAAGAA